jgi:hypothetical protein
MLRIVIETVNGEDASRSPYADALKISFEVSRDFKNLILYQKHVHARGARKQARSQLKYGPAAQPQQNCLRSRIGNYYSPLTHSPIHPLTHTCWFVAS